MATVVNEALTHIQNHLGIYHYKSTLALLPFLEQAFEGEGNEEIKNCPNCQNFYGISLFYGAGVEKDALKGIALIEAAAKQGLAKAQYNMVTFYEHGEGVEMDLEKAYEYCKAAVDQGDPIAKRNFPRISRKYHTYLAVEKAKENLSDGQDTD